MVRYGGSMKKTFTLAADEETWEKLRFFAYKDAVSVSAIIRRAIDKYIKERENESE